MKIFLTGGTGGVGAALVGHLAAQDHQICFTFSSRSEKALALEQETQDGGCVFSLQMDVRDPASVDAAVDAACERLDGIDLVINNAAVNSPKLLLQQSDQDWLEILSVNLTGSFFLTRAFLMPFLAQGSGRFIHMGSISAKGMAGQAAYSAAKAGLEGLSASTAREYGAKGIRSNVLRLGLADVGMGGDMASDQVTERWLDACASGRLMEMRDVFSAVDFLADPGSDFINGAVIPVTGGVEQI
ncbi:SDR family NAD(P)-dependent oxidoreductase [Aestuariispira insulae]|uniref:3-oxoacyl-[acyl-carrier protein] reductase n=1 Tax=Aestuariispira insulae TaxID=1461337 RepID=A0A3D9HUN7_9PROT|nr:SDR family oxidoreductase [Aestuariispira insulae]RED53223.1 3-oxoacyl-[acyl-carrier protein] reductase [Aestuariispira insulae]